MQKVTQKAVIILLHLMAMQFNLRPRLRRYLRSDQGWINFTVGFRTEDGAIAATICFHDGKVRVLSSIPTEVDTTLIFSSPRVIWEMLGSTPNEVLNLLMHNRLRTVGNFTYLNLFNYFLSLLLGGLHGHLERRRQSRETLKRQAFALGATGNGKGRGVAPTVSSSAGKVRLPTVRLKGQPTDGGVKYLKDPYLSEYDLDDFPRLKDFLDLHFTRKPEICPERPLILTEWFKTRGFEKQADGSPWIPELRQAMALKHLLKMRQPIIRKNDLLAGTTTSKEVGVIIYPDGIGTMIWGELQSVTERELNPYHITEETRELLHHRVFPYWANRNFREYVRAKHGNPLVQQLDERFAVYFVWKTVGISHTIPDFPKLLRLGAEGIIAEIDTKEGRIKSPGKGHALQAMKVCLEGLTAYASNLSRQAALEAAAEIDPARRRELEKLAEICARVPAKPARTLDEAVNALWIGWVGLHMENSNTGLSLGRLDQWLQPYFEADLELLDNGEARQAYIRHALELVGCLFLRCTDHLPLVPDLGNYLFGGASSDQAITLGGLTPEGEDGVNDMTYIFLKVTELLALRDPNINARYHREKNSDAYLKRLCEVNLITAATPSMHNDLAVMAALAPFDYPQAELNDWSAVGCVEPTLSGRHMGHTGSFLINLVAALEMALNSGKHPLMNWKVGPDTGYRFETFDQFCDAFKAQFAFLSARAVEYNNQLAEAHVALRPTPLLSSLMDGCIEKGLDVVKGGAKHNSSGCAVIGLADVTDSLMVIKRLVYDEGRVTLEELLEAVRTNFRDRPELHALAANKVPLFGSGSEEAVAMADKVANFVKDCVGGYRNYRGGNYRAGFWSMSNHVAFGTLAQALPSGRLAGKAFTPGLTPQPAASSNLLDNIHDVARLDPVALNNNIAFNVKVVPGHQDSHERVVDTMKAYVGSYFDLGGMQMQMNVVTSEVLRDAMAHPEAYRNLLVRISGYNAYFVTLNRDMQLELIERAEYRI